MLSNIIKLIHLIIVLSVISSPFINNLSFKKYIFYFLIYLLFQYLTGYEKCGLTDFEYYIMGEKYQEGFIYRIIKPLISVNENYFNKYLLLIHLIYILILYYQLYQ